MGKSMKGDGRIIYNMVKESTFGLMGKELLQAIRVVASGETHFGERAKRAVLENLIPLREQQKKEGIADQLTDREKEILILIAEEHTQEEIAAKLFISTSTVVYHKRKLMAVLEVKGAAGLVRKAGEMGLLK